MATRELVLYPSPILKTRCAPVAVFDGDLHKLLDDMIETMYAANGVGLAAPQIGVTLRVAVIDVSEDGQQPIELVNPEITARAGKIPSEEGCLSIPDYRDTIQRSTTVTVRARNRHGEDFEVAAEGLLAMALQHELDHLDGILFVDHLSRLKREMFRVWLRKSGLGS